jgi:excisionase family DNA binding protein
MPQKLPTLYSPSEVASVFGVSRSTLYVLMQKGELQSLHVGRKRKFTMEHMEDFIARMEG